MVLNQGENHPTLGRNVVIGVIKHALSADTEVLPARKIVLNLIIPADKCGVNNHPFSKLNMPSKALTYLTLTLVSLAHVTDSTDTTQLLNPTFHMHTQSSAILGESNLALLWVDPNQKSRNENEALAHLFFRFTQDLI